MVLPRIENVLFVKNGQRYHFYEDWLETNVALVWGSFFTYTYGVIKYKV